MKKKILGTILMLPWIAGFVYCLKIDFVTTLAVLAGALFIIGLLLLTSEN